LLKDPENDIVHPKGLEIPLLDFSHLDSDDDGELKHSKNKKPEIQQNTSIISLSHFSAPNNDDSEKENAKNGSNKDNETHDENYNIENQQRSAEFKMSNGQMNGDNSAPSESAKSVCSSLTLSTPDRLSILKINQRRRRLVEKNRRTMSCERVGKSSSSSSSCRENDEKVRCVSKIFNNTSIGFLLCSYSPILVFRV